MNELYKKVKERLSLRDNMYDNIRIIDPINKNIICISNNEITKHKEKCYDLINRGRICSNCISMRADIEKDTFIKIEHVSNKVMLIAATPVKIEKEIYIVEIIKDISSKNNMISNINCNFGHNIKNVIDKMNEKIITDDSTGMYNRMYIQEKLPVEINNSVINEELLSIIMIDINDFNNVKKEFEQDIEEKILKDFSKLINDSVMGKAHWTGRYSDDKFIIVLNSADKDESYEILEQIKKLSEDFSFQCNDTLIKLNVNFSVYCSENKITDIKNILIELEESILEEKQIKIQKEMNNENKTLILSYRIQELRNILNEMNISSEDEVGYEQTLKVSQDLDELIVEYMKNII